MVVTFIYKNDCSRDAPTVNYEKSNIFFLKSMGFFSGMSAPKQAPPLFPHCTENTPNCDLNAEVCTEP